jgi:hypothetical protein
LGGESLGYRCRTIKREVYGMYIGLGALVVIVLIILLLT